MNDVYLIPLEMMAALQSAIFSNYIFQKQPVTIYQLGQDERGRIQIGVVAYGHWKEEVHKLCLAASRGNAILLPARNIYSKHIGTPKKTLEFEGLLYHVGCRISKYGMQYIHRFQDQNGNELTWSTGKPQPLGKYSVVCRVKSHDNFFGVNQTAVTHCRFEGRE